MDFKPYQTTERKRHPLYTTWRDMRKRCRCSWHPDFARYGGRGVTICQEWNDFYQFARDMGPKAPGMTLDRIDNDGPYAPWNCRWASRKEQTYNRAATPKLTYKGETLSIPDWARRIGISVTGLKRRIAAHGIDVAMTAPRYARAGTSRQ